MAINTQNFSTDERTALANIAGWVRQAVTFAIAIQDFDNDKRLGDPQAAQGAFVEAQRVSDSLWDETVKEGSASTTFSEAIIAFSRKTFGWCDERMKS